MQDTSVWASIIWDGKNGVERINFLIDGLMNAIQGAEIEIQKGNKPKIPDKYSAYVRIHSKEDSLELEVLDDVIQEEIEGKGFHGLITSRAMSAKEANDVYDLLDCSEKQYSLMKTQLGDSVFRAHNMHRNAVRKAIAFVASIIRHEIMVKCREAKPSIDTNTAIKELNLINMNLIGSNCYRVIHNQCKRQKAIMRLLGITAENLDQIATYETNRLNRMTVHPVQTLSSADEQSLDAKSGKRNPGISKGSKNKSNAAEQEPVIKRNPGRPKGSKNKPKPDTAEPTVKRKPGRPKGSKNKPKT